MSIVLTCYSPLVMLNRGYVVILLPACASEQGNVIGLVSVYKKIVIERTRDLIYLKFVATDIFPKIPSDGENSGDSV